MHLDAVAVSGANQYRVKPSALVSTATPPISVRCKITPVPAGAACGAPALATATPSRARASSETAPTPPITTDRAACTRASIRAPEPSGLPAFWAGSATIAAMTRIPKAATSISPAAIPARVRISLNPNNPIHTASR